MQDFMDEYDIRKLPPFERLMYCKKILRTEKDESLRWDAVWIAGELAEVSIENGSLYNKIADLMASILRNDESGMVKHEACYQIAMRKMLNKIPDLVQSALYDKNGLVKHEAIEALALLDAFDSEDLIKKSLNSSNEDVKQTAQFCLSRLSRRKNKDIKVKSE